MPRLTRGWRRRRRAPGPAGQATVGRERRARRRRRAAGSAGRRTGARGPTPVAVVEPQPAPRVRQGDDARRPGQARGRSTSAALAPCGPWSWKSTISLGQRHRAGRPGDDRQLGRRARRRTAAGSAAGCRRGRRRRRRAAPRRAARAISRAVPRDRARCSSRRRRVEVARKRVELVAGTRRRRRRTASIASSSAAAGVPRARGRGARCTAYTPSRACWSRSGRAPAARRCASRKRERRLRRSGVLAPGRRCIRW